MARSGDRATTRGASGTVRRPCHNAGLQQANLTLEVLRFQVRLAKDLHCLKVNSYAHAGQAIDEIGRLVGGWIKSSK